VPRIVINDTSCLLDLHKVGLLLPMLQLPYEFQVALPVRENELLTISEEVWAQLEQAGLLSVDLAPENVSDAMQLRAAHAPLSAEDCMSLALARAIGDAILLTGDMALRRISQQYAVEIHGVLWVVDELYRLALSDVPTLRACIESWRDDPHVRLPAHELTARLRRFGE
jgi:predicted nucleic acid-binding protein